MCVFDIAMPKKNKGKTYFHDTPGEPMSEERQMFWHFWIGQKKRAIRDREREKERQWWGWEDWESSDGYWKGYEAWKPAYGWTPDEYDGWYGWQTWWKEGWEDEMVRWASPSVMREWNAWHGWQDW